MLVFWFTSHIMACLWVLVGQFQENSGSWYLPEIQDMGPWHQYTLSMYFVITTMTTVGYGDFSGQTTSERLFVIFLMLIGVLSFTYISGALASVISNVDSSQAEL
jgi:hypothetical protein